MPAEKFPIEAGHIMLFARSIADKNPIYYGDDPIAPPTFAQSSAQFDPNYFLRPVIGEPWFGSGGTPTGITDPGDKDISSGLHAEQHFEYHRHIKPGDVLTATSQPGETWEKQGRSGGKLQFSESITEYRDQNGELAITARSVGVKTEKPPAQG